MTSIQLWFCDDCGTIGALKLKDHEDVMSVIHRMGDQHKEVAPKCQRGTMMLQSIVPENLYGDCLIRRTQGSSGAKE